MIITFDEGIEVAKRSNPDAKWRSNPEAVLCRDVLRSLLVETNLPLKEFVGWVNTNTTIRFNPPIDVTQPKFEETHVTSVEVDEREFVFLTLKYVKDAHE